MENWRDDLNSLIDETMAFAKSVRVEPPLPRTSDKPNRMPSVNWISSEREEIWQRVANFKAHQQRDEVLALSGSARMAPGRKDRINCLAEFR